VSLQPVTCAAYRLRGERNFGSLLRLLDLPGGVPPQEVRTVGLRDALERSLERYRKRFSSRRNVAELTRLAREVSRLAERTEDSVGIGSPDIVSRMRSKAGQLRELIAKERRLAAAVRPAGPAG
jgi:hypothetical protein